MLEGTGMILTLNTHLRLQDKIGSKDRDSPSESVICEKNWRKINEFILFFTHLFVTLQQKYYLTTTIMETRKFKQVPSINRVGERNPAIPKPVVVNCGKKKSTNHGRTITRTMRSNSRTIGAGEPINWDEVYSGC